MEYTLHSPLNDFHTASSARNTLELALWKSLRGERNVYFITYFGFLATRQAKLQTAAAAAAEFIISFLANVHRCQ